MAVPGFSGLADLNAELQVFGGDSPEHAHAPLRIAGAVTAKLRAAS
ncbi:hypothetical protein [Lysobacter sp. A3-1-A15]